MARPSTRTQPLRSIIKLSLRRLLAPVLGVKGSITRRAARCFDNRRFDEHGPVSEAASGIFRSCWQKRRLRNTALELRIQSTCSELECPRLRESSYADLHAESGEPLEGDSIASSADDVIDD